MYTKRTGFMKILFLFRIGEKPNTFSYKNFTYKPRPLCYLSNNNTNNDTKEIKSQQNN